MKYVGLHIPAIAHWTVILDQLHCAYQRNTIFSGIVLDIIKAFNVLQRRSIFLLPHRAGVSIDIVRAWEGSLRGLTRSTVTGSCIFGSVSSTTVWAMYIMTWYIAWSVEHAFPGVDMRAFADNWELTGDSPYDLVRSSAFLHELARLNRLDFSSDKCYAWSTGTDTWEDHFRETVFSIFSDPENGSILKHRPIWIIRQVLCVWADFGRAAD